MSKNRIKIWTTSKFTKMERTKKNKNLKLCRPDLMKFWHRNPSTQFFLPIPCKFAMQKLKSNHKNATEQAVYLPQKSKVK